MVDGGSMSWYSSGTVFNGDLRDIFKSKSLHKNILKVLWPWWLSYCWLKSEYVKKDGGKLLFKKLTGFLSSFESDDVNRTRQ